MEEQSNKRVVWLRRAKGSLQQKDGLFTTNQYFDYYHQIMIRDTAFRGQRYGVSPLSKRRIVMLDTPSL